MQLAELQKQLASSLAVGAVAPAGVEPAQVAHARGGLEAKRRRAAGHLLPELQAALGPSWRAAFHAHAQAYVPAGLLYHVDDAWELAEVLGRSGERGVAMAARRDLLALRIRFQRSRRRGPWRIRERRWPLVAVVPGRPAGVVLGFPGGRSWTFRLPSMSVFG